MYWETLKKNLTALVMTYLIFVKTARHSFTGLFHPKILTVKDTFMRAKRNIYCYRRKPEGLDPLYSTEKISTVSLFFVSVTIFTMTDEAIPQQIYCYTNLKSGYDYCLVALVPTHYGYIIQTSSLMYSQEFLTRYTYIQI